MTTRRDRVIQALDAHHYLVMVCGAGWHSPSSEKRRQLAEVARSVKGVHDVVIPEDDPAPDGIGAARDELESAEDCSAILLLLERDGTLLGADGETLTFSGIRDFFRKAFIFVPPRLHELVSERRGYLGHTIANHPRRNRYLYSDEDYTECALRIHAEEFVSHRAHEIVLEIYQNTP